MTPHRASNMGGGGGGGGSYAPYGDSPYGPSAPKHSVRRGGQRSSLGARVPETMDRTFDNDYTVNAGGAHQKHRHAHTSASGGVYSPPPSLGLHMLDRKDRNHGNDLATLKRKHAALEAQLQARAREGRPYDESDGENAEAIIFLFEIERDIARLEKGEGLDDGREEDRTRTGGMDFQQKKSHAGGRARQDARGHGGLSEFPKRSSNPATAVREVGRRHLDGSGHTSRHEDDIAPPTRDFSRLGVEPREPSGKTPRPPPHHHDYEDFHTDEASAGHRGSSGLPKRSNTQAAAAGQAGRRRAGSGHAGRREMTEDDIIRDLSRLAVRSREHGKTPRPARHHGFEALHADEALDYHQPRRSLSGHHHQPPTSGHGRSSSGRFADHESRAPSRHQKSEDYTAGEPDYPQPRGSHHGRHVPLTSGYGHSSSRRFAANLFSSR